MKIIKKTHIVEQEYPVYVASDGKEFRTRFECELYEHKLGFKGIKVVETAIPLRDFEGEHDATLYNIENEEDWNILVERVWFNRQYHISKYPGPGVYYVITYPGGDYPDEYEVMKADQYLNDFCLDVHEFIDRFQAEIARFYVGDENGNV